MKGFWEALNSLSTPFAVFMIVAEMGAGLALLTGWKPRFTVWALFLMTLFFTLLTGFTYLSGYCPNAFFGVFSLALLALWMLSATRHNLPGGRRIFYGALAASGVYAALIYAGAFYGCGFTESRMKVTDCGCFGDFIKLKPWETFWKDIVLDALIYFLVVQRIHIRPVMRSRYNYSVVSLGTLGSLAFCLSNFMWGLPIVDFRPYKEGNNIYELRQPVRPEQREFVFVYKNKTSGEQKEFGMSELDQATSDWEFVDRIDRVTDPGIPAKISNLYINDPGGEDVTDELLRHEGYSLMAVIYNMKKTRRRPIVKKLVPLAEACATDGIPFYAVCSGDLPVDAFRHELQTPFPFYTADDIALKTMIRSNPGLVLLKNGVVVKKWHRLYFPKYETLKKKYFEAGP
jgi:hypothetical protein